MDESIEEYKQIEGQCGTCGFASSFEWGICPSGPKDAVNCTSKERADSLQMALDFERDGYVQLYRLEALAEETFRCPHWKAKGAEVVK